MAQHHLAQINIGRLKHPLDAAEMAEFAEALEPVNRLAESSPGFVWRLTDPDGASSSYVPVPQLTNPLDVVNYSIWEDLESLKDFVFKTDHVGFLRRRGQWFERSDGVINACWWVTAGVVPSVEEAYDRLEHLRANGPSDTAWAMNRPVPRPVP